MKKLTGMSHLSPTPHGGDGYISAAQSDAASTRTRLSNLQPHKFNPLANVDVDKIRRITNGEAQTLVNRTIEYQGSGGPDLAGGEGPSNLSRRMGGR